MSALAPILQGFFTDRLHPSAPGQPTHHRRLPRQPAAADRLRRQHPRQTARRPGHHRPGRRPDRGVPDPPGGRAGQQREHPQRPPGRGPVAVPLRRAARPRRRRGDPTGAGHPAQARRPGHRGLPDHGRDRRAAGRARPGHLARPTRPRAAHPGRPDRTAGVRADRPDASTTCTSGPAHTCAATAKGRKEPDHPADPPHHRGAARLAERTSPVDPTTSLFPTRRDQPLLPRRRRATRGQARRRLPVPDRQEDHPAHLAAQLRDGPAARRRGHHRDRALARPRADRHHDDLPARRPHPEEKALNSLPQTGAPVGRYRPPDAVLAFLDNL